MVRILLALCCLAAVASLAGAEPAFSVRAHGAQGDGVAKDTAAIQRAIEAAASAGGGTVDFPAGKYLSGTLHLRSHVTLHLDNGATIIGSPETEDYDKIEKLDFKNAADVETSFFHFALIAGEDIEHIGITGQGMIDCNRSKRGGPKCIALKRCKEVLIRDVRLMNCPNYNISLLGTDYVNIDGVTIVNGYADGIDPDACRHVTISNCNIDSQDDAIVPKTSFSLGQHRSTEYLTVTNCVLATACTCFKLGTESGGDFKYITVSNCVMTGRDALHSATGGIALESVDGSNIDGVTASNCAMQRVDSPIFLRLGNRGRDMETPTAGTLRNVCINNITAQDAKFTCSIAGLTEHYVENVTLSDVRLSFRAGGPFCLADTIQPEMADHYPDADMWYQVPSYGFYVRHVRGLRLVDIDLGLGEGFGVNNENDKDRVRREKDGVPAPVAGTGGHALVLEDGEHIEVRGFSAPAGADGLAPIRLTNVQDAVLEGCRTVAGAKALLEVAGVPSRGVYLLDPRLPGGVPAVGLRSGTPSDAVVVRALP